MERKKGLLKGAQKGLMAGVVLIIAVVAIFAFSYVYPVFALHNTTTAVVPAGPLDTSQAIQLNFTITRTGTEANISIFDINFTAARWDVPAANNSITCSSGFNSSLPGGGIIRCFNFSVVAFGGTTFNITVSGTAAPAYPVRSNFTTNTTEVNATSGVLNNITNSSTVGITVSQLAANVTVNDTTAAISSEKNYNFTVRNNGTDAIDRIIINYTDAGFGDPNLADITCPSISGSWDASADAGGNTVTCTSPADGQDLTTSQSATMAIASFDAPSTGGVRTFQVDIRGALGGNFTLQADRPTVTVFGTMALTSVDRASSATTVQIGVGNKVMGQINLSSTGENLSSIQLRVNTIATNLGNDISRIMVFNDSNCDGAVASEVLLVSDSVNQSMLLTLPSGGNIPQGLAQCYIVAYNISANAVGGNTLRITVGGANVTATGGNSSQAITSTGTDFGSSTVTIFGALNVTGTNRVATTTQINRTNVVVITYNFTATGENANVTNIQVTRTGTATAADIVAVALYNESAINDGVLNGTETLIGWNTTGSTGVYNFTSLSFVVRNGSVNYQALFVVFNISGAATGGRTFGVEINPANVSTTAAVSGVAITETVTTGASTASTIFGNSTMRGINQNANTTVIGSVNVSIVVYNITATGEAMNLSEFNVTMLGNATAADIPVIALYNSSTSTAIAGATLVSGNGTRSGISINFTRTAESPLVTVASGSNQHLIVVFNVSGSAAGGNTFGADIATANLTMAGGTSATAVTPALSNSNSSTSTIFGNLSVTAADMTPSNVDQSQEAAIINLTFVATGEAMKIREINITMNNTNNNDVTAARLYNDSTNDGLFTPADSLIATATLTGSIARFGSGSADGIFNVTSGATRTLIVTFVINASAAASNKVDAYVAAAANITVSSGATGVAITTLGAFPLNPATNSNILALSATAGVNDTTQQISTRKTFNFTVVNPSGGDSINEIRINYTATGYADTEVANVTCPTIGSGTWDGSVTAATKIVKCTKNSSASVVASGSNASVIIANWLAPSTAGVIPFEVTVNGSAGGNYTIFSSVPNVTTFGTLTLTGTSRVGATTAVGTRNVTVVTINFTSAGEQMNISEILIERNGTSIADADISAVSLYNETLNDGVFNATETFIRNRSVTTNGKYNFSGLSLVIGNGSSQILLVVFNISSGATGGRTFGAGINVSADVATTGSVSGQSIAETITSGMSTTNSNIFGNSTITGINVLSSTVNVSATNVTVIIYNITAGAEQMNLTWINITRLGTGAFLTANTNITAVGLFNNSVGTGLASSTLIRWNATSPTNGVYIFNVTADGGPSILNISSGSYQHLIVVFNISGAADVTFGNTVGANIATANLSMLGSASGSVITPTLSSSNSSLASIVGTSAVTGINQNTANRNLSTSNVTVIIYNITATGEAMNLTNFNITKLGSFSNSDIGAVGIFNNTVSTALATATLIAWNLSAPTAGVYNFSAAPLVRILAANNTHLLVVFNITSGATGGRTFGADTAAANISVVGATSGQSIGPTFATTNSSTQTIFGTAAITGITQIATTTNVSTNNNNVIVYNITATGEAMNLTEFNVTMLGTGSATDVISVALYNSSTGTTVSGATLISGNGTRSGINVRFSGSPIISVAAGNYHHLIIAVNVSSGATVGNTFGANIATANLTISGGTSNIEATPTLASVASSTSTIIGTSSITGISQVSATTNVSSVNVTVIVYNITATGEQMNLTWLNVTRLGTVQNTDIVAVGLFNNSVGTGLAAATLIRWNTSAPVNGVYVFNITAEGGPSILNVSSGSNQHVLVVFNISGSATGGRTFGANIAAANLSIISSTTGQAITPTLTSTNSSLSTIFATATITGINQLTTVKVAGTSNVSMIVYNITATGEAANITRLNITRLGTANSDDIAAVGIYNNSAGTGLAAATLIAWNTSAPTNLVYNFSGAPILSVSAGGYHHIIVVFNLTSTATGGRTFGANIATANLTMVGGTSNIAITPVVSGTNSSTLAISTLNITGINKLGALTDIGANNVTVIVYNITAVEEQMNLTAINITRIGSSVDSDVVAVGIYNNSVATDLASSTLLRWNTSIPSSGVYNFTGASLLNISSGSYQHVIVVFNISGTATGGRTFGASLGSSNLSVTSATSGAAVTPQTLTSGGSNTSTIAGTLTITGTSRAPANATVGTGGIVVVTLNFSATSEQMNISEIIITRNGTNIGDSDITTISLYNDTINDGVLNGTETFIGNRSVSTNGRYNFSSLSFRVASGGSQIVFVVVNLSNNAFGGRTFGAGINVSADIVTTGGATGQSISETISTGISVTSTINGNVTVTGTNRISQFTISGTPNVTVISYSLSAVGETMNITNFNVTRTGTAGDADIVAVGLFNATNDDGILNATETLIRWNLSAPSNSVYNFSAAPLFTVTNGTTQVLLLVINVSSGAGGDKTLAFTTAAANMTITGGSSGVAITPTVATLGSNTSNITTDNAAPTITATAPTTAAKVTTSSPSLLVNTSEAATCKFDNSDKTYSGMANTFTGTGTTHNYTLSGQNDGVYAYYVRCADTFGNTMTASGIVWFEIDTRGNFNYTQPSTGYFAVGWSTLFIPTQTIMESAGKTAGTTGSFNFTSILSSLSSNWNYMYYNVNGSSTGWVLATRTDPGGSTLKFVNNTNDKPYFINITASNTRFTI